MSENKCNPPERKKFTYAQDGRKPAKGRALNTANPPTGGSGVPPKTPVETPLNKK